MNTLDKAIALALTATLSLTACSTGTPKPAPAQNMDQGIPSEPWLNLLTPAIADNLCQDDSELRACFNVSRTQCDDASNASVTACASVLKPQIPQHIKSADAKHIAGTIGVCAAKAFALMNQSNYIDKPGCEHLHADRINKEIADRIEWYGKNK